MSNFAVRKNIYLWVYLESFVRFKCSFAINKATFFKAFNDIFGKVGVEDCSGWRKSCLR